MTNSNLCIYYVEKVRIMVIMRTKTAEKRGDILRFEKNPKEKLFLYLVVPTLLKPLTYKAFRHFARFDSRSCEHAKMKKTACTGKVQTDPCMYSEKNQL